MAKLAFASARQNIRMMMFVRGSIMGKICATYSLPPPFKHSNFVGRLHPLHPLILEQDVRVAVVMRLASFLVLWHETGKVIGNELASFVGVGIGLSCRAYLSPDEFAIRMLDHEPRPVASAISGWEMEATSRLNLDIGDLDFSDSMAPAIIPTGV
jgi:hypothetical protein